MEPDPVDKDGLCLLSLDGGGVRGLSTLHILKRVMDEINRLRREKSLLPRKPFELFDMIGGTSTGGLIAIMLGRLEMDVDECITAYEELMGSIFEERAHWLPFSPSMKIKPKFSSQNVRTAIEKVLQQRGMPKDTRLNDGNERRCKVFVCAVEQANTQAVVIRSFDQHGRENIPATICEAALATSAATGYFASAAIGARHFVDGALRNNNPVNQVEDEARQMWCPTDTDWKSLVKCFVSVGTGAQAQASVGDNVFTLMARTLVSIATDSQSIDKGFQDKFRTNMKEKRLFRFDVAQGLQNVALDDYRAQEKIEAVTAAYMDESDQQTKLNRCAENLTEKEARSTPLDFHETVSSHTFRSILGKHDPKEHRDCRAILHVTDVRQDREDLEDKKGRRVKGTFEWIETNPSYQNWLTSESDTLWIKAGPSRGKTMLSLFILENLEQKYPSLTPDSGGLTQRDSVKKSDLYYFFCSSEKGSRRSAIAVLRSLIHQIISQHPDLMKHVLDFLQPTASGTDNLVQKDRPTVGDDSIGYEAGGTSKTHGLPPSAENQSPLSNKLSWQPNLMKHLWPSRAADEQQPENSADNTRGVGTENEHGSSSASAPTISEKVTDEPGIKEHLQDGTEKQSETQPANHSKDPEMISEKDMPKSRQLELLGTSGLSFILKTLIREMDVDRAYFILDGLDECDRESQEVLKSKLLSLQDVTPGRFKLLIASQPMGGLGRVPTIELGSVTSDLEKFVSERVDELANIEGFNEDIRYEVEQSLLNGAKGTFLWVSLVLREINKKDTCTDILKAIKKVPPGLNNKYRLMLRQVDEEHQEKVFQILSWVIAAVRPFTVSEISVVIQASPEAGMTLEQAVQDEVTFCKGLLEERGGEVRFIHDSVKEFLLSDQIGNDQALRRFHVRLEELHYNLAQFCYDCIRNSELCRSEIKVSELSDKEEPRLLKYAIKNWMDHVRNSNWAEKNFDPDAEFFRSDSKLRKNWWTAYLEDSQNDDPKTFTLTSLLHLAAYFGIVPWIKRLFDRKDWLMKQGTTFLELDYYRRTPLHIAVEQNRGPTVSLLLEYSFQGIDIEYREASMFATPLLLAARNGHENICDILLKSNARIDARNRFDATALTEAARGGYLEIVKLLLAHNADVNGAKDKKKPSLYRQMQYLPNFAQRRFITYESPGYNEGSTPIIEAAGQNHVEIIKYLKRNGADIEVKNLAGLNALHTAAENGHVKSLEVLVKLGANIDKRTDNTSTALFLASYRNYADAVKWLLDHEADIDAATDWGFTALLVAARNDNVEPMKVLLDANSNIEHVDQYGNTALAIAAKYGKTEAVNLLLKYDANTESKDHEGNTALMHAIKESLTNDDVEIVQILLKNGANVQHQNNDGLTPLMKTAGLLNGDAASIIENLLDQGAELDTADKQGRTALMHALNEASTQTRKVLIESGASLEAKNDLGDTALILAAGYSEPSAVEFLLEHGADIEARDTFGFTPLLKAARCGMGDTIETLLKHGANITATDNEGKAAIDHAALRKRGNIIQFLTPRGIDRNKMTLMDSVAASLSDMMHWTEDAVRVWERKWEQNERKKLGEKSETSGVKHSGGFEQTAEILLGKQKPNSPDTSSGKTVVDRIDESKEYDNDRETAKQEAPSLEVSNDSKDVEVQTKPEEEKNGINTEAENGHGMVDAVAKS